MTNAKIIVPAGMLGAGFTEAALRRGVELGADAIAIDGGSTDSGPAYLGRPMPKMPAEAIAADLRTMMKIGIPAGLPIIVGSAGTSGTDVGVDWVAGIVETIRQKGANASVNESSSIEITSTHTPQPLTHAEPSQ